jgi:hypothetical protein
MKTSIHLNTALRTVALCAATLSMVSCSSFEHPLTRHDIDGDGFISHSEYQQNHMQYDMADRQRCDEYARARQINSHVDNVGDILSGADRIVRNFQNFGR